MNRSETLACLLIVISISCLGCSLLAAYEENQPIEIEYDEHGYPQPAQIFPFPPGQIATLLLWLDCLLFVVWLFNWHQPSSSTSSSSHP